METVAGLVYPITPVPTGWQGLQGSGVLQGHACWWVKCKTIAISLDKKQPHSLVLVSVLGYGLTMGAGLTSLAQDLEELGLSQPVGCVSSKLSAW